MDFRQIDKFLQTEFAKKRMRADKIASRNFVLANKNPAYRRLDEIERELSFEISRCKTSTVKYKNLKENLSVVRKEKAKVLKSMKLKESDLKPKYECKICEDTGFVSGGRACICYKKRKNEELIKAFGLTASEECTFGGYNTKICKNEKQAANLQKLAKVLQKWAAEYPDNQKNNILISGQTGVGKTYLASCLANEMLKKEYSVCFVSAFALNESLQKYHTTFDGSKSLWLDPFIDADILIIDDLGTEPMIKNVTENYLYLILSERERFSRPVIITTNLKPADINSRYDERIYSRLCNKKNAQLFRIEGDDLRIK